MTSRSRLLGYSILSSLIIMAGCVRRVPTASVGMHAQYVEKRDNIELRVERLDVTQTREQFGRNLIRYGYQPIRVTVFNESDDQLFLRAASIDLPIAHMRDVYTTTEVPMLGYMALPAYAAALFAWPLLIPIVGLTGWMGVKNYNVKSAIRKQSLGADKALEILPFERITRMIFVPVDATSDAFSLHLFNVHDKAFVPFNVKL